MADLEQNTLVKDKTLFIIEDDKPFRERLTTSFQRKDFTVTAAASKKEALDVLAGNNFSKGTNHIKIDSNAKKISIADATFGNTGIQLDYNSDSFDL